MPAAVKTAASTTPPPRFAPSLTAAPLIKPAFRRLVMVLQGDQQALDRPQRPERHHQYQRQPQHGVHPIRRLIDHFGDQRREHHDGAAEQDHEYRRSVAGIGEADNPVRIVRNAAQGQKPLKQPALAATRTAAAQILWRSAAASSAIFKRLSVQQKGRRNHAALPQVPSRDGHSGCGTPAPHTYMQANRNSHTTSTKCQYQAANSKPRCCLGVNWPRMARIRHTIRKIEPMITWAP